MSYHPDSLFPPMMPEAIILVLDKMASEFGILGFDDFNHHFGWSSEVGFEEKRWVLDCFLFRRAVQWGNYGFWAREEESGSRMAIFRDYCSNPESQIWAIWTWVLKQTSNNWWRGSVGDRGVGWRWQRLPKICESSPTLKSYCIFPQETNWRNELHIFFWSASRLQVLHGGWVHELRDIRNQTDNPLEQSSVIGSKAPMIVIIETKLPNSSNCSCFVKGKRGT